MNRKGITLIELLIVMVIVSVLLGAIYRTFISQQHTYTVQEQVVDMQQNVRMGISQMVRDIRMGGFGRVDSKTFGASGMHGVYKNIISPGGVGSVTVVAAYQEMTTLAQDASSGTNTITVNDASGFTTSGPKEYICINGTESHRVKIINGNQITFFDDANDTGLLVENHYVGEPVFLVKAISYSLGVSDGKMCLLRDENLGNGPEPVAENIESLRFMYTLDDGSVFWDSVPGNKRDEIRMIQVTIVARTDRTDPELSGDGYRRRTLTSNIQLRNLAFL
jgi:prepilin-type N-terminal cleavage/methylation domain-containing protein